ncbi:ECF RNA polymerase sigma factor SigL [Anaerolineales bacterium]|nr:ECF RNA polymerase sigma factor SigL [Anaerolineales bacterium]
MISEQELLTQAGQFDTRALAEIYDLYSPRLYRYAMRLLGDASTAEDCVSETFSRFLKALHAGKGPRDYLQAYLFRTAHNLVIDHYRRHAERVTEELDDNLPELETTEGAADLNLNQSRVRDALLQLTEAQQQVVALKFLEGWDNEAVAKALNKPVGAVKSLQHRALAQLQKLLLDEV